jgi:hypothetical protein
MRFMYWKYFFTRNNGYTFKLEIQFLATFDDIINYAVDNKYIIRADAESVSSIEEIDIHLYNEMEYFNL